MPHEPRGAYPILRGKAHRRGQDQEGDHPLPQEIHSPRDLPGPLLPILTQTLDFGALTNIEASPVPGRTILRCSHSPSPTTQQTRFALPAEWVGLLIVCQHKASHWEVFTLERKAHTDKYMQEVEDRYAGYTVYDRHYERMGNVDDLFVDENDSPHYIGVKMGFLGTRTTLIPFQMARVNDARQLIEVAADKEKLKNGPTFDEDREITPQFEKELYSYYGLKRTQTIGNSGSYGSYYSDEGTVGRGMTMGDTETGEFREHAAHDEGVHQSRGDDLADEDELRVQRTEEELVAGTRQREAGSIRVRKRVRTDRERIEVPTRHEEVSVQRVPVEGEASEAEIGEDEVVVPVTEEEIVVHKRPVLKEEVRIRKDVVEETEVVEEDVRREEVEVEDRTQRRGGGH